MSYNLYNEDDEFKPPPTPILEIEVIKEGESYSCTECSSDIEIFYIDDKNNKIAFKCQNINEYHGEKVMSIKNFLRNVLRILIYIVNVLHVINNKIE